MRIIWKGISSKLQVCSKGNELFGNHPLNTSNWIEEYLEKKETTKTAGEAFKNKKWTKKNGLILIKWRADDYERAVGPLELFIIT